MSEIPLETLLCELSDLRRENTSLSSKIDAVEEINCITGKCLSVKQSSINHLNKVIRAKNAHIKRLEKASTELTDSIETLNDLNDSLVYDRVMLFNNLNLTINLIAMYSGICHTKLCNLSKDIIESSPSCSVCLLEFGKDEFVSMLYCKHVFHSKCIDYWLISNTSCPCCRYNLRTYDDDHDVDKSVCSKNTLDYIIHTMRKSDIYLKSIETRFSDYDTYVGGVCKCGCVG